MMTNNKQQLLLLNINRALIYFLALCGLFFDYTWAYVVSLTLWVWLAHCIRYEKMILVYCRHLLSAPGTD